MNIILNRYHGDHFENSTTCDVCRKQATVAQFTIFHNIFPTLDHISICLACLNKAAAAISAAVLKKACDG
jgi:hypothetical protein